MAMCDILRAQAMGIPSYIKGYSDGRTVRVVLLLAGGMGGGQLGALVGYATSLCVAQMCAAHVLSLHCVVHRY